MLKSSQTRWDYCTVVGAAVVSCVYEAGVAGLSRAPRDLAADHTITLSSVQEVVESILMHSTLQLSTPHVYKTD